MQTLGGLGDEAVVKNGTLYVRGGFSGTAAVQPLTADRALLYGIGQVNPFAALALHQLSLKESAGALNLIKGRISAPGKPSLATLTLMMDGDTDRERHSRTLGQLENPQHHVEVEWFAVKEPAHLLLLRLDTREMDENDIAVGRPISPSIEVEIGAGTAPKVMSWQLGVR